VEVTGVYTHNFDASLNTRQGFPVFNTVVEANFVQKKQDAMAIYSLTEEDKARIHDLARDPHIADRVRVPLCPVPCALCPVPCALL
jgi:DNA replication licensing factor MCM2